MVKVKYTAINATEKVIISNVLTVMNKVSSCSKCNGLDRITDCFGDYDGYRNENCNGPSGYTQISGGSINMHCTACDGSGKKML